MIQYTHRILLITFDITTEDCIPFLIQRVCQEIEYYTKTQICPPMASVQHGINVIVLYVFNFSVNWFNIPFS